jgi:hypothetical protein
VFAFCLRIGATPMSAGVAKGGRILERRSGDLEVWIARPAKGNPMAVSSEAVVNWR